MSATKKDIKLRGTDIVRYTSSRTYGPVQIEIPLSNCQDLVDYLDDKYVTGDKDEYGRTKNLEGKFEIYVGEDDIKTIDKFLKNISTTYQIDMEDLKNQIRSCRSIKGRKMYKIRIFLHKFIDYLIPQKQASHQSLSLHIYKVVVYQVQNRYYLSLTPNLFQYSDMNLSSLSIDPDSLNDYLPTVCEIDKLKRGYRPYISGLKNKLQCRELKIDL